MTSSQIHSYNAFDLHQAVVAGRIDCLRDLLNSGTTNSQIVNKTVGGATALSLTLYMERYDCFELLLNHSAVSDLLDMNIMSKDDKHRVEPVLVTACRLQSRSSIDLLLKRSDTNMNSTDTEGRSALWMATNKRNVEIVRILLAAGADPNHHSVWQLSPLYFAVRYSSKRLPIAGMLIEAGADVAAYSEHHSLLHVALKQGDRALADLLVAVGYPVSRNAELVNSARDGRLSTDARLKLWILKRASEPISLLLQCRVAVRRKCCDKSKLATLSIPTSLINYLQLADVINSYYDEFR